MIEHKSILIFGAGINQLELIRAAKELNVTSVVIDPMPNPPGAKFADFFYQVDGKDYDVTKNIAIRHNVNGLVTTQMENPLRIMARLANELGLIFHSPEIIEKCRNKFLMKEAFIKADIPCAKGLQFSENDVLTERLLNNNGLFFPLIIKPIDAFSSRGVFKVDNFLDFTKYMYTTSKFSSNNKYIVEEFMDGPEFSVESITFKGETHIIQYTEKFITPYPHTVELGHLQPARISESDKKNIDLIVPEAIKALEIDNSVSHTELKITKNSIKIIEIGARPGGDFIGSYLTKASTGISMDKAAIQIALGEKPTLSHTKNGVSLIKYIQLPVGSKVKDVLPIDDILKTQSVEFAYIFLKSGENILPIDHSAMRPACFIVSAQSYEEVEQNAVTIENKIKNLIKLDENED